MRLPREMQKERARISREKIIQLCDKKPMRKCELVKELGIGEKIAANYIEWLAARIKIIRYGMGANARWMSVRLFQILHPTLPVPVVKEKDATPVVFLGASFGADWSPKQEAVQQSAGVKITVYSGPRDRFAPDIKPGHGAISGDWMLRRQGVQLETRVPAYA